MDNTDFKDCKTCTYRKVTGQPCEACSQNYPDRYKTATNAQFISSMGSWQLAHVINAGKCGLCTEREHSVDCDMNCHEHIVEFLRQDMTQYIADTGRGVRNGK